MKSDQKFHCVVDNDENEHQLLLRMECLEVWVKDELDTIVLGNIWKYAICDFKFEVWLRASVYWRIAVSGCVARSRVRKSWWWGGHKTFSCIWKRKCPGSDSKILQKRAKLFMKMMVIMVKWWRRQWWFWWCETWRKSPNEEILW